MSTLDWGAVVGKHRVAWSLSGLLPLLLSGAAVCQSVTPPTGGAYTLTKQVIAAGGARTLGGSFVLTGTLAQTNAGPAAAGNYQLNSGFHAPGNSAPDVLFRGDFED